MKPSALRLSTGRVPDRRPVRDRYDVELHTRGPYAGCRTFTGVSLRTALDAAGSYGRQRDVVLMKIRRRGSPGPDGTR